MASKVLRYGMPVSGVLRYTSAAPPPALGACDNFCYDSQFRDTVNTIKGESFMKFSNLGRLVLGLSFLLFGTYTLASPPAVSYHLLKKVPLAAAPGGTEYFDYITVDSAARRVYVSHGTEVVVLNADDYTVVGTIGGLQRCHGVVVVKALGKGYITDGEGQKVVIFDLKTLKVTGEVKTNQPDTDSIIYAPASKYIFTIHGDSP